MSNLKLPEKDLKLIESLAFLKEPELAKEFRIQPKAVIYLISIIDRQAKALEKAVEQRNEYIRQVNYETMWGQHPYGDKIYERDKEIQAILECAE